MFKLTIIPTTTGQTKLSQHAQIQRLSWQTHDGEFNLNSYLENGKFNFITMNLFSIKEVTEDDIDNLYQAIVTSTNNKTKVTQDVLQKALTTGEKDSQYKTNRPVLGAFIATEKQSKLIVGQLLFVTHYTPWIGHMPHVIDLYVKKEQRRLGIATHLLRELEKFCQREKFKAFTVNNDTTRMSGEESVAFAEILKKLEFVPLRDANSSWSVYRLML